MGLAILGGLNGVPSGGCASSVGGGSSSSSRTQTPMSHPADSSMRSLLSVSPTQQVQSSNLETLAPLFSTQPPPPTLSNLAYTAMTSIDSISPVSGKCLFFFLKGENSFEYLAAYSWCYLYATYSLRHFWFLLCQNNKKNWNEHFPSKQKVTKTSFCRAKKIKVQCSLNIAL